MEITDKKTMKVKISKDGTLGYFGYFKIDDEIIQYAKEHYDDLNDDTYVRLTDKYAFSLFNDFIQDDYDEYTAEHRGTVFEDFMALSGFVKLQDYINK